MLLLDLLGEPLECVLEPKLVEDRGAELECQRLGVQNHLLQQRPDLLEVCELMRGKRRRGHCSQLDLAERKALPDVIVEIRSHAAAFALLSRLKFQRKRSEL